MTNDEAGGVGQIVTWRSGKRKWVARPWVALPFSRPFSAEGRGPMREPGAFAPGNQGAVQTKR